MPYNPAGLFSLVASYFASPGTTIRTEQHNPVFEDVASALSSVVLRDGRAPMTGALDMNNFAIINVAPGTTTGSVATIAQASPLASVMDYAGPTPPAGWAFCAGQAISRTAYSDLFAIIGTTFGAGNGTTTFNLPDARGCVVAAVDTMGGSGAGRLTGSFGQIVGTSLVTLGTPNLPPYTPTGSIFEGNINFSNQFWGGQSTTPVLVYTGSGAFVSVPNNAILYGDNGTPGVQATITQSGSGFNGNAQGGIATPFPVVQPTLILNKIIKVSYDV